MELGGLSKLTKADIVDAIYNKIGVERKGIHDVVDLFLEEVKSALVSNKVIELRGFGTFEIKIRKGREKARNPKTGEILSVNSHGIAVFRAGRELRQDVWSLKRKDQAVVDEKSGDDGKGDQAFS
jgi:integration host factor subunit beta